MWHTLKSYLFYTWGGLHRYFGNQNNLVSEHRRAVHYFGRALEANPEMRQARLARAVILWRELEQTEAALADLDFLLDRNPHDGAALFNRALAHQQAGGYEVALLDIRSYLALSEPDSYHETAVYMESLLHDLVGDNTPHPGA